MQPKSPEIEESRRENQETVVEPTRRLPWVCSHTYTIPANGLKCWAFKNRGPLEARVPSQAFREPCPHWPNRFGHLDAGRMALPRVGEAARTGVPAETILTRLVRLLCGPWRQFMAKAFRNQRPQPKTARAACLRRERTRRRARRRSIGLRPQCARHSTSTTESLERTMVRRKMWGSVTR